MNRFCTLLCIVTSLALACASTATAEFYINPSAVETVEWLPSRQSDYRLLYGTNSNQFGDLRIPKGPVPAGGYPVLVFLHGGGWSSDWNLGYTEQLVEALNNEGIATWSLEFRRLGNGGGGYPGTFMDAAAGTDFLRRIARRYHLDLDRVIVGGHSSGGHLALWIAGRKNLPASSPLYSANPLEVKGVVSLASVVDLEGALTIGNRTDVLQLLNVTTAAAAEPLFPHTNPMRLLPYGVPTYLMVGTRDNGWRQTITQNFAVAAASLGDTVELVIPDGANHFDVVDAYGPAYPMIAGAVKSMLGPDVMPKSGAGRKGNE
jgi:acetyl esterase/lipase